jgi:hypothetical protein
MYIYPTHLSNSRLPEEVPLLAVRNFALRINVVLAGYISEGLSTRPFCTPAFISGK